MERPARVDRDTDRAEHGKCFDTQGQVFPLDEHQGQGRYPTYTLNSKTDTTCRQNGRRSDVTYGSLPKTSNILNI